MYTAGAPSPLRLVKGLRTPIYRGEMPKGVLIIAAAHRMPDLGWEPP